MVRCESGQLFLRAFKSHPRDFLLDAYAWANVLYFVIAVCYVAVDLSQGFMKSRVEVRDGSYVALALLYVLDAALYWISWRGAWPHPTSVAIAAEFLNIALSLGFLCTASMYHAESGPSRMDSILAAVVFIEVILSAGFVGDAVAYALSWWTVDATSVRNNTFLMASHCSQ